MTIKIVEHDNTRLVVNELLKKNQLIVTSNSSMQQVFKDASENELDCSISFDKFEKDIFFEPWFDLKFELEVISIINTIIHVENLIYKDELINDVKNIMESIRSLVLMGVTELDSGFNNIYNDDFVRIFNIVASKKYIRKYILKFSKVELFREEITRKLYEKFKDISVQNVNFFNIDKLSIHRIRTMYLLNYFGFEVNLYVPVGNNLGKLNQCWIDDYWRFGNIELHPQYEISAPITYYFSGKDIPSCTNSSTKCVDFLSPYDFKKSLEVLSNIEKVYAFDHEYINKRFDSKKTNEHGFTNDNLRFILTLLNLKKIDGEYQIEFVDFLDILNSGWIQYLNLNGRDIVPFLLKSKNYFKGSSTLEEYKKRLTIMRTYSIVNESFERNYKESIKKDKVIEYLVNPFRVFSHNQVNNESFDVDDVLQIVSELELLINEVNSLKVNECYYRLVDIINFLKTNYKKNVTLKSDNNSKEIEALFLDIVEYEYEMLSIEDVCQYFAYVCANEFNEEKFDEHGFCSSYAHLDSAIFRNQPIHITDLSYRSQHMYDKINTNSTTVFTLEQLYEYLLEKKPGKTIANIFDIAISNKNNRYKYRRLLLANLLEHSDCKIKLSYITGLDPYDIESSEFRILKSLHNSETEGPYFYKIEEFKDNQEIEVNKVKVKERLKKLPEISFRDVDFCKYKFFYGNIVQDYPLYKIDFHQRLAFMNICSYMKAIQLVHQKKEERLKDVKEYVLPLFPQWSSTDKEDMLYRTYKNHETRFKIYKDVNYPYNLDKMQILWSKYLVTKKWRIKRRYKKNSMDLDEEIDIFINETILKPVYGGRQCMFCTELPYCSLGVHIIDRH